MDLGTPQGGKRLNGKTGMLKGLFESGGEGPGCSPSPGTYQEQIPPVRITGTGILYNAA